MIEIRDLTKIYDDKAVVDSVSFTVQPGTISCIVGTSGSGKTTLMRMVNRMTEATSGSILIDGQDNGHLPVHELRRKIGYVIQNHGLFPHRTVAENVATVPGLLGWDKPRIAARVNELLALFQLDPAEFGPRYPHELSGGQQQRVGVARALAAEPNILLMDEPFGALDPIIRAKAQNDLLGIQKQFGTTIILVTHDMDEAMRMGDRIAVMDSGKLVQYATPAELLAHPATEFVDAMLGTGDRPFRYLALNTVDRLVEQGMADGAPIAATANRRDALAELLWSGRDVAPVAGDGGAVLGIVRRARLLAEAARPA
ncbi:ABC transporter ATP-binding protein [Aureimonas fodinaquatilis]|uniref:ABC transporter ATP-binding protein n=1 Tax=Aureimonas fodinaquatilis TaxID=2565783 RepID=A0A5B0E1B1_9HYPH|nr:ABC transporter ATP-binding protein [Aureimonas fodinaquatilis]KAA0972102.1 ABC transporter ATP-binding protein [Aureimonas fodinaquatilis]